MIASIRTPAYSIHFNEEAYTALNTHLTDAGYSKIFILVDENTHEHCLAQFMGNIEGEHDFEIIEIESGEVNKNIHTCTQVWEVLSELDADRKSLMINLGGGVVTDLGGFVASAYKRGIAFINVPTTLLSMVDASVGGKTGVDLGSLKNQIGFINQPVMVLVVSNFLKTLDQRQLNSGYAEMLKHGLIQSEPYWNELKEIDTYEGLGALIHRSVIIKNEVVLEDPTEQHLRKILNYGHTLGHAVESYFLDNPDRELLLHGEAIAIGMVLEAWLSHQLEGLTETVLGDIKTTFIERYGKIEFSQDEITAILELLKYDKKNSHGNINFVLLKSIGVPSIDVRIDTELLRKAFAYYML